MSSLQLLTELILSGYLIYYCMLCINMQSLGSLSSNATVFSHNVPSKSVLVDIDEIIFVNNTARFNVTFFLLLNEVTN